MKKIILILYMATFLMSCDKYPDPGTETLDLLSFQILGNNQTGEAASYLTDSVGIIFDNQSLTFNTNRTLKIEFEIVEGGGSVDETVLFSNNKRKIFTRWKLGDSANEQILRAIIYDSEGKYLTKTDFTATAFLMDKWNKITKGIFVGIQDMISDTINKRSMLISGGGIYINTDKFYNWQRIYFSFNGFLGELEMNSKGEVFGGGWDGNLYKSSDWGETWILLSKPILGNDYHFELSISRDDYIWVSRWDKDMHCSTDGGLTWKKDTSSFAPKQPVGPVFQFNDTSHLALAYNIVQTFDEGITWKVLNTPQYPSTLFVTDKNEIILQNQDNGFTLHKSTDSGKTFKRVFSPTVAFGTTSWHCYAKYKNFYYVLAPGGGVWKTKDFEEFEELITFSLQRHLFMDHKGTIYAGGFNYVNAEPDPTYILPFIE